MSFTYNFHFANQDHFDVLALLSTHLLSLHLPTHLLIQNLSLLGSIYLLKTGSFTTNLVTELASLRVKPRSTSLGISTSDLNTALFKSCLGTELDPDAEFSNSTSSNLDNFKLVLTRDIVNSDLNDDDAFSRKLLGPSISLTFEPTRAMGLILTKESLKIYGRVWSYLMSIRSCHSRLLSTWATISHSQRLRSRFVESGLSSDEIELREITTRQAWTLVKSMIWLLESLLGHFQTDVIDPAYKNLLDRVEKGKLGGNEGSEERDQVGGNRSENEEDNDATTIGGTDSQREREYQRSQQLDFNSLTTIHSLYLSTIVSGCLLNSEIFTSKIMEILDNCDFLCSRIDRWSGEILPSLLSGGFNEKDSSQGNFFFLRFLRVLELNSIY